MISFEQKRLNGWELIVERNLLENSASIEDILWSQANGVEPLSNLNLEFEVTLQDFMDGISPAGIAFEKDPEEITSDGVLWGSLANGVKLTSEIKTVSTLEDLQDQIENGLETGAFESLEVFDNNRSIFLLTGSENQWSISSGELELSISGKLPTSMSGLLNFITDLDDAQDFLAVEETWYPVDVNNTPYFSYDDVWQKTLSTPKNFSETERANLIDRLKQYDLDALTIKDEGVEQAKIALSDAEISFMVEGVKISLGGTFPNSSLGDLFSVIKTFQDATLKNENEPSLDQFENLDLNKLTITDDKNDLLLHFKGDPSSEKIDFFNLQIFDLVNSDGSSIHFLTDFRSTSNSDFLPLEGHNNDNSIEDILWSQANGVEPLSNLNLEFEVTLQDFMDGISPAGIAFEKDPEEITSDGVLWGSLANGVKLTSEIKTVSTLEDLQDQIENGLETGAFESLEVFDNNRSIFLLTGSENQWSISSGELELSISGKLPTSMSGLLNFITDLDDAQDFLAVEETWYPVDVNNTPYFSYDDVWQKTLSTPKNFSETERANLIDRLKQYDLDALTIKDEGVEQAKIALSDAEISFMVEGVKISLGGTFPNSSLGDLFSVIKTFQDATLKNENEPSLDQFENLDLNKLTITDDKGLVVASLSGSNLSGLETDLLNDSLNVGQVLDNNEVDFLDSVNFKNISITFFDKNYSKNLATETIEGTAQDDHLISFASNKMILAGQGDDLIEAGLGQDLIFGDEGNDLIVLKGYNSFNNGFVAKNTSSPNQIATNEKVNLVSFLKIEDVIDGGAGADTIKLDDGNLALFLHDGFSGFHSSVSLVTDSQGLSSTQRLSNIEIITGSDGNNIIDLTSPDYSLAEQSIEVDGGSGEDIIWGSDANETIQGGVGDDIIFGGAGTNILTGGLGADEFQFTMTSTNDRVTDFNTAQGDTLKFFNTGGAEFDKSSVKLNDAEDGIDIDYLNAGLTGTLSISLGTDEFTLDGSFVNNIYIV